MTIRLPWRLPTLHGFTHDARQLILASGLICGSFLGAFSLLRSLYLLRLGLSPAYVGVYLATGSFVFMVAGLPAGALAQRFGTRRVMLISAWLAICGMALLPLAEAVRPSFRSAIPILSQLVLISGWGSLNVVIIAALASATQGADRSRVFAMRGALQGIGTLSGTLIGGVLPGVIATVTKRTTDDATPYGVALLIAAAAGLMVIRPLSRIRGGQRPSAQDRTGQNRGPFPFLVVAALVGHVLLKHSGWTSCQAFCNPYMDTELRLSTATIGIITGIGQVAAIAVVFAIPQLAERWHHGWIVTLSSAILSVSLLLLAVGRSWLVAASGLLGVQVAAALWLPALQVYQMERVPEAWRAIAYGTMTTAMGSGFGVMSLFGGYFIDRQGYQQLFQVGFVLSLAGALLMAAISSRHQSGAMSDH
ncbi:MAG: MFS transporter [Anaerolineae bacterium]|jgi:MFS family permease|nr:MFS transporter [Anaerolineae bacterium]